MERGVPKICIATLDPANKGGILSMMDFFYSKVKEKHPSTLVYNILPGFRSGTEDLSLAKFIFGSTPKVIRESIFGMDGLGIQRVFPAFEFFNYILNLRTWSKSIEGFDKYFAIGGSNNAAAPFAFLNKEFMIWVASPLLEDREGRIKREPFFRKVRDLLSLPFLLWIEKYVFKKTKKILALSNYTKKNIINKYPFTEDKIETIFYPVNINFFKPKDSPKEKRYILFTGRLSDERKNIKTLISAFARISPRFKDLKLILVGGSPSLEMVEMCKNRKVEGSVEFLEFMERESLLSAYQGAELFVIPSLQEGLCISGLEAMSCGLPVVSTKCGGPEDFIIDGVNGLLCENNDEVDMAEKLMKFFDMSTDARKKMSIAAREHIVTNHNPEKIWEKFEKNIFQNE